MTERLLLEADRGTDELTEHAKSQRRLGKDIHHDKTYSAGEEGTSLCTGDYSKVSSRTSTFMHLEKPTLLISIV